MSLCGFYAEKLTSAILFATVPGQNPFDYTVVRVDKKRKKILTKSPMDALYGQPHHI